MKKLLSTLTIVAMMCLTSCDLYYEIGIIRDRLDQLEKNKIATISEQVANIEASIVRLETVDREFDYYIEELVATNNNNPDSLSAHIATLQERDGELELRLDSLRNYVTVELASAKDWASATFATLEQYNALAVDVASLKSYVDGVESTLTSAIANLESSMQGWVNEQLTGYYTIAEIDAKIDTLQNSITEGDKALQAEIDALTSDLATAKEEITAAYTSAITEAITANNGVIDEKIATEIAAVNEKIGTLEERLNSLEERISAVEDAIEQIKALDIIFSNTDELACLAGAKASVDYTIVGGDEQTTIEAFGNGGWSADIVAESAIAGKVVVTAPSEISKRGKVVVLATSGAGGVAMKSLHFDEGVLTGVLDTYEVDWEACTLAVTLKTNLSYSVEIPADAQAWISIAETTRATVRTETITLSIAENPEDMPDRSVVVKLVGECGDVLQSFEVTQKLRPSSNFIVFADPIVKKVCVEKFDTNGDGELSELEASRVRTLSTGNNITFFGDYDDVVKSFDELRYFTNLTAISDNAFGRCSNLTSITIPDGVTSIGQEAFYRCSRLASITIPDSVTSIGWWAFSDCSSLTSVTISDSVTSIGDSAFSGCSSIKDVYIANLDVIALFPTAQLLVDGANIWLDGELLTEYVFPDGTVKIDSRLSGCTSIETVVIPNDVVSIDSNAFRNCYNLKSITIPDSVISIGDGAFSNCSRLASITIPDSVISIGYYAFANCSSLESVTIGNGVTSIGESAFYWCTSLASITISEGVTSIGNSAFDGCASLVSISIPDSVTSIGSSAFRSCSSLASITIPEGVTWIGEDAFFYCTSLVEVYCKPTTPPSLGYDDAFYNNASGRKIYVPRASVEDYKTAEGWSEYANAIEGYDFE